MTGSFIPTDALLELIKLAHDHGLAELSVSTPLGELTLTRGEPQSTAPILVETLQVPSVPLPESSRTPEEPADRNLSKVASPLMGVFYRAVSPGAAPLVEVGDRVMPGDVLCIVEAMKVMNEIVCETAGTIEKILPKNGDVVEAGATLFLIRAG